MTRETTRRILWLALVVALPVPYWAFEAGWVPTMWLVELAGFSIAMVLTEGGMVGRVITGLFVGQAVLWIALLYVTARLGSRAIHALVPASWQTPCVATTVLALLGGALLRVYATPLVEGGARVNLLRLFP